MRLFLILLGLGARFCSTLVYSTFVDSDTDEAAAKKYASEGFEIVFSDEFNTPDRQFKDGDDPTWTALDKNDYTNAALHYYKDTAISTSDGMMKIKTDFGVNTFKAKNEKTGAFTRKNKYYTSGQVQTWNKFCFTGGIIEVSASPPGHPSIGGLWPAIWMMGNLARATYVGSSDWMWPWSYDECEEKNQESQLISKCAVNPHFDLLSHSGRGAPEIDIFEGMAGPSEKLPNTKIKKPYFSTSLQVSPGVQNPRPVLTHKPLDGKWYEGMSYGTNSSLNNFFYGVQLKHTPEQYTYQSDAISANTAIEPKEYSRQHVFKVDWRPNDSITWYLDDVFLYKISQPNLNITGSKIPDEPMYLILNTAISSTWGFPTKTDSCKCTSYDCSDPSCTCAFPTGFCDNIPSSFDVDWVRIYQHSEAINLGCSTKDKPTRKYIQGNEEKFKRPEDDVPIKSVRRGGGDCDVDGECGGGGKCDNGGCVCGEGYTGPMCLAEDKEYPGGTFLDETDETIEVEGVHLPAIFLGVMFLLVVVLVAACCKRVTERRERMGRYEYIKVGETEGYKSGGRYDRASSNRV
ncbi:hypothetical protein TrST_g4315 [Triparma strigata]|uniref:GH16 domain-containing protein n=1 Tax=Triparma strigata TaxID=1606541 RepID=A0A9W7AN00_9STRA|nr:hypothetical protein TrST_g4315 [Triparma strigata]